MPIAIVHLSDIHALADSEGLIGRADAIIAAAQAHLIDVDELHIVTTGDIAFSGKAAEYEVAKRFYRALADSIRTRLPAALPHLTFCAGNHDCDFSLPNAMVREALIPTATESMDRRTPIHPSIAAMLLEPQANFASFCKELTTEFQNAAFHQCKRGSIDFQVFNSALLSRLSETSGALRLAIPIDLEPRDVLSVAVFHHPPGWMSNEHAKFVRKSIEQYSDIILTGHEHEGDAYSVARGEAATLYMEGHALWGATTSAFQIVDVNRESKTVAIRDFVFETRHGRYLPQPSREIPFVRSRRLSGALMSVEFEHELRTIAGEFSHPRANRISVDQLYVAAELEDRSLAQTQKKKRRLVSADLLPDLIQKHSRIAVAGDERSGRTTLAKRLFLQLYDLGAQPILVSGKDISSPKATELVAIVRRAAARQYGDPSGEQYTQLSREKRVIIIDDAHLSKVAAKNLNRLFSSVSELFHQSIVIVDGIFGVAVLTGGAGKKSAWIDYQTFAMGQYGRRLRGQLIERWQELGAEDHEASTIDQRISESEHALNAIFGKGLLPSYPVFILTSLQLLEMKAHSAVSGSLCHTYEHLTTAALARANSPFSHDTMPTYAAWIAFRMLALSQRNSLPIDEAKRQTAIFASTMRVEIDFEPAMTTLENAGLIVRSDDAIAFSYIYAYYYFAAKFIQDNAGRDSYSAQIQTLLAPMVASLHVVDNANVVLFVLYLTRDERLIEKVIAIANSLYVGETPCRMEEDVSHLGIEPILVRTNGTPRDEREAFRAAEDDSDIASASEKEIDEVLRLNGAIRTLEILGQILRNSPGSISGPAKESILATCYLLGLRILGYMYRILALIPVDEFTQLIRTIFEAAAKGAGRHPTAAELDGMVRMFMGHMNLGLAVFVVRRISTSVGSKYLKQTYRSMTEGTSPSAAVEIIDGVVRLEHLRPLPVDQLVALGHKHKKNVFASALLKQFVHDHLRLFSLPEPNRQKLIQAFSLQETPAERLAELPNRR